MEEPLQGNRTRSPTGPKRRGRRFLLPLALVVALAVPAWVLELSSDSGAGTEPADAVDSEPRLGVPGSAPAARPGKRPVKERGRRATVVQLRQPGQAIEQGERGTEEPPARVLAENAKLRRELEHLKALEAERRRVARVLSLAAADFNGPLQLGPEGLAWPTSGPVVSPFGQRWGRLHAGIDIAAPAGAAIRASQDGLVVIAGPTGGYGNYVCVQHTKQLTTCYAHLSRFATKRGKLLRQGDPIGLVGCTGHCFGDHLHFETWLGGKPVDPMRFF